MVAAIARSDGLPAPALDLSFCDKYNYPEIVRRHLSTVGEIFRTFEFESALLIGSTSRGELSVYRSDVTEVWSDYEFFLFAPRRPPRPTIEALRHHIQDVERGLPGTGRTFHIDFSILANADVAQLPNILRIYEARATGITLFGEQRTSSLPIISADTIDRQDLNDILLWRLWSIILYFPSDSLLHADAQSTQTPTDYAYVLCRNALDLLTWALPHEGVLLPSFTDRLTFVQDHQDELRLCRHFDAHFLAYQERCLTVKLQPELARESHVYDLFTQTAGYFLSAGTYLQALYARPRADAEAGSVESLHAIASSAFTGGRLIDRLRTSRGTLSQPTLSLSRSMRSFLFASAWRADMIAFLYAMLRAAQSLLTDSTATAEESITHAADILNRLDGASEGDARFPATRWVRLRRRFANDVLARHFPSVRLKQEYVAQLLGNDDMESRHAT
jgi:hypothetical protein